MGVYVAKNVKPNFFYTLPFTGRFGVDTTETLHEKLIQIRFFFFPLCLLYSQNLLSVF